MPFAPNDSTQDKVALSIARLGFAGFCPIAPGTAGSALAILLAPFLFMPFSLVTRCVILCVVFGVGVWAAGRTEEILGAKDPGEIVVDELFGVWVCLLPFETLSGLGLFLAFALFRVFDIVKPWPVHASESWLPAGGGVMIDDGFAGLWAMLILYGIMYFM